MQTHTNGVDVSRLMDTISAVKENPSIAEFKFKAHTDWVDGGENKTSINSYYGAGEHRVLQTPFVMTNEEPPVLLGNDSAPNPVEYVLNALAGCLTTSMVFHAAARGIEIDAVETDTEGEIDIQGFLGLSDKSRKGYQNVRVKMRVKSNASVKDLSDCAMYSPVYDMVSRSSPVDIVIETH